MSLLENQAFLQLKQGIFLLLRSIRIAGILMGDPLRNSARRSHHKKDDQTRRKGKEEEKNPDIHFPHSESRPGWTISLENVRNERANYSQIYIVRSASRNALPKLTGIVAQFRAAVERLQIIGEAMRWTLR